MIRLFGAVDDGAAALEALARTADLADGTDVRVVAIGGLACLVGEQEGTAPPPADADGLRAHDQVLRRVMTSCTVVPFRYGTAAADPARLREHLQTRNEEIRRLFDRLRGRCELALRARPRRESPALPRSSGGSRYLRDLGGARPPRSARDLHRAMASVAVEALVERDDRCGVKAAYLVDAAGVDAFCGRLAERRVACDDLVVSLTGPWAPYSFVTAPRDGYVSGALTAGDERPSVPDLGSGERAMP